MRLAILLAGLAVAGAADAQAIAVTDAWIRPPPPGAPTAAAYATLTVRRGGSDRLIGGSTPVARAVEVHEMSLAGGVMRMRPMTAGVLVAPGRPVRLAPGGLHLMLIAPTRPLRSGDRAPVTLRFAHAGPVRAVFVVGGDPTIRR